MPNHPIAILLALHVGLAAAEPWAALSAAAAQTDAKTQIEQLQNLALAEPDFLPAQYNLGCALLGSDPASAAQHFERASASAEPLLAAQAGHNLALARYRIGQLEAAVEAAAQALAKAPESERPGLEQLHRELRRIALVRQDEARRRAQAEAKRLRIAQRRLPDGFLDTAYTATLTGLGGSGQGYRFSPDPEHPLPEGLLLGVDGTITGTPTTAGEFQAELLLSDDTDANARGPLSLRIWPAPAMSPDSLPECIQAQPYQARLRASGLPRPQWTVSGLPEGLNTTPSANGLELEIQGQSSALGTYAVHIRAADGARQTEQTLQLVVSDSFAPNTDTLPPATAWAAYEAQLTVRGPAQDYTWQSAQGDLSVERFGRLTGTPQQAGISEVPLEIHAQDGRSRAFTLKLPVNAPPVISPDPIQLRQADPADKAIGVQGGTPPLRWSLVDGVLPSGLRLDEDGHLRGTPGQVGEFPLTLSLSDRWDARTRAQVKLTIEEPRQPAPPQTQDQQEQPKQDQQQDQQQAGQAGQDQQDQQNQQDQNGQNSQSDQAGSDQRHEQKGKHSPGNQEPNGKQEPEQGNAATQAGEQSGEDDPKSKEQQAAAEAAAQDAAGQAQVLGGAAAQRWLDNLPEEERKALLWQLYLDQGAQRKQQDGQSW